MKKNILIISYAYPPNNVAGAQRPYALAKYLDKTKYNIKVITCENPDLPIGNNPDFNPNLESVELIKIKSRIDGESTKKIRKNADFSNNKTISFKSILIKIAQKFIFPDKAMFWYPNVKTFLFQNKQIIENTDNISIYRYCKTNGGVITTPSNLNLCNEGNCKNCTTIKNKIDAINQH
jgi:hypothetical protein